MDRLRERLRAAVERLIPELGQVEGDDSSVSERLADAVLEVVLGRGMIWFLVGSVVALVAVVVALQVGRWLS